MQVWRLEQCATIRFGLARLGLAWLGSAHRRVSSAFDSKVSLAIKVRVARMWWRQREEPPIRGVDENLRAQLAQALETFRFLLGLERQAWAVFAAGDVLLVVYAFNLGIAGPVYFGLALLGALYTGTVSLYHQLVPVAYVAYRTERELGIPREIGLASTYGRARAAGLIKHFDKVAELDPGQQPLELRSAMRVGKSIGIRALIIILTLIGIQLVLALLLSFAFDYPLFSPEATAGMSPAVTPKPSSTP